MDKEPKDPCDGQDVDEEQSIKESFDFQGEFLKFLKSSDSDFSSIKSPEEVNPPLNLQKKLTEPIQSQGILGQIYTVIKSYFNRGQ